VAYDRRKLDPPDPPSNQACRQSFTWNLEVR
jgi:hypothetical protein